MLHPTLRKQKTSTVQKLYCLAVWIEKDTEIEDVISLCWVDEANEIVRYPSKFVDPLRVMIADCTEPNSLWYSFKLVKVKRISSSFDELVQLMKAGISTEDELPQDTAKTTGSKKKKNLPQHFLCDLSDVKAEIPMVCDKEQQKEEFKSLPKRQLKITENNREPCIKAKEMPDVDFSLKSMQSNASEKAHSSRKSRKFNSLDEKITVKPLAKKSRDLENDMEEISGNNSKIITKTIKTITEVGRPKSAANEYYPLGTIEFQQKLFMQLNDQKERLKNIEKSQKIILKFLSKDNKVDEIEEISKAESIDRLKDINKKLDEDPQYRKKFKKTLEIIALTCSNARQHMNGAINTVMSVNLQTKVNVLYGNHIPNKDYCDHVSLRRELPEIFKILVDAVSTTWNISVKELQKFMSEWLKNAPKRASRDILA